MPAPHRVWIPFSASLSMVHGGFSPHNT